MSKQTKLIKGQNFVKGTKCENSHSSALSNAAWCDLNSKRNFLELYDLFLNAKCKCQIKFTSKKFQLEGAGPKNKLKILSKDDKPLGLKFSSLRLK